MTDISGPYSPAAAAVMELQREVAESRGEVATYEESVSLGMIETGFLAEHIMLLEGVSDEEAALVRDRLSDTAVETLVGLRRDQPRLWQEAAALQNQFTDLAIMEHLASLKGVKLAELVDEDAIKEKKRQKTQLMTRIFRSMEPLDVGVALELCQPPQP
jgi:hypothetical protein